MNNKLLKKLREFIRRTMSDLPAKGYFSLPPKMILVPDYSAGLNLGGTQKMRQQEITGSVRNHPKSQRGAYRAAKKAIKATLNTHHHRIIPA